MAYVFRGHRVCHAAPLPLPKAIWHACGRLGGVVNHHRQQEWLVVGHEMRAVDGELPFEPEVALTARVGVGRDDRDEKRAFLDHLADRRVPRVASAKFALIEPHLKTCFV